MMHNASKALLGSNQSSAKDVSIFADDPADFPAGLAVSLKSTGILSLKSADGFRVGVSLGRSLSDTEKTSVLRTGERVPVRLALKRATGTITISSYANLVSGTDDAITVGGVAFTAQTGAATLGQATFQAATSNDATATSLAAQINAHATTGALVKASASSAVVTLYALAGGTGGNDIAVSYTDNDSNVGATLSGLSGGKLSGGTNTIDATDIDYVTIGAKAYINDKTGYFDKSVVGTVSDAVYVSSVLTGIDEDGNSVPCALVDMPGGL